MPSLSAFIFVAKPLIRDTVDELLDGQNDYLGRAVKSVLTSNRSRARRDRIVSCVDGDDIHITTVTSGRKWCKHCTKSRSIYRSQSVAPISPPPWPRDSAAILGPLP